MSQISTRFEGMTTMNDHFMFLSPKYLTEHTDDELAISARKFSQKYEADVSQALDTQVVCFKNIASNEIKSRGMATVKQLATFSLIENNTLSSSVLTCVQP